MGTIRFTTGDGNQLGLHDHEGYIAQVFEDGTIHGGGNIAEVNRRTVAFRAVCECGWRGPTIVPRQAERDAWREWEDLPLLEDEWIAHTDPFLDSLAHHGSGNTPVAATGAKTTPAGGQVVQAWSLVEGDVHLPAAEADWWGATLSILNAAIHRPELLRRQQPDTDPVAVAREALDELGPLRDAVELAERAPQDDRDRPTTGVVSARGDGDSQVVVISPGSELRHLVWLLDVFAHAVIEPGSHPVAYESASGHVAGAWSRDLGVASGAIQ